MRPQAAALEGAAWPALQGSLVSRASLSVGLVKALPARCRPCRAWTAGNAVSLPPPEVAVGLHGCGRRQRPSTAPLDSAPRQRPSTAPLNSAPRAVARNTPFGLSRRCVCGCALDCAAARYVSALDCTPPRWTV
jgi:hypothetical protein